MASVAVDTLVTDLTIGGRLRTGSGPKLDVVNPATEALVASIPTASLQDASDAVTAAGDAFANGEWSRWSAAERGRAMARYADLLAENIDRISDVVTDEMGSPASLRATQIAEPINFLRWAATQADRDFTESLGPTADAPNSTGIIAYRPVGVVLAITAYNYPITLALYKIASVLAAGCTLVLMPSPQAPLSALMLGELAIEAGLPAGVINVVVGGADIAEALTLHEAVGKISFTGSVQVGKQVMQQAGRGLKGVVLELGGKNPNIILPDVDLAPIVRGIHVRYARNAGQGCGSTTRIFVHESRYEEFVRLSREMWSDLTTGDPRDPENVAGPVISAAHRDRILGYIQSALDDGGEILAQGEVPTGPGFWAPPSMLGNVPHASRAVQEEIFGPVSVLFAYATIDEVVERANDVIYGLGGNIYANKIPEAIALAGRIRAANMTINGGGAGSPLTLIGGFKQSGIGREHGVLGIKEFLEPQTIRWPL
jgi:acyl-CoA reductase-like NAD-dependent aldehyde dehydrogenase